MFCTHHWTSKSKRSFDSDKSLCILPLKCYISKNLLRNGVGGSLESYCSLKPSWSGTGEVVPACTSPTLHLPSPPTVL